MSNENQSNEGQQRTVPCSGCGRSQPLGRAHSIKGRYYCTDCLVAGAEMASLANQSDLQNYSPGRAAVFALLPGLGAVYNQQYVKAVQHFSVFAALAILGDYYAIFVLATIVFYIYTIVDAYRSAQDTIRRKVDAARSGRRDIEQEVNVPIWGGVLIALGLVFFLDNIGALSIRDLLDFTWPLLFVALGLYLIIDFYRRRGEPSQPAPSTTGHEASASDYKPPASPETPPPAPPKPEAPAPQEPTATPGDAGGERPAPPPPGESEKAEPPGEDEDTRPHTSDKGQKE